MRSVSRLAFGLGMILALGGCATSSQTSPRAAPPERTFLGLVTVEEADFTPPPETTLAVAEGELVANPDRTGRKVTLLWGLITYTDY